MNRRRSPRALAVLACVVFLSGCDAVTERRLAGRWESEATPKRTMALEADRTYSLRLSGKTLGFVSDLIGPETGVWRVDGHDLVLTRSDGEGTETTTRLAYERLSGDTIRLGGALWKRVP